MAGVHQINEATKLIEQGVCSFEDIDTAMVHATGVAEGPMSRGREIPADQLTTQLEALASRYGKTVFEPTETVRSGGHIG